MTTESERPGVGLGIIVQREGHILLGRRKGRLGGLYSIPGGMLEPGETFEEGAIREVVEETGLLIVTPRVIAVTNNLETFASTGIHHVSIILHADRVHGEPRVMEPDKCAGWFWYAPEDLPEPHFESSRRGIACFLQSRFYVSS